MFRKARIEMSGDTTFTIREAAAEDIPALAALHVQTYNDTHLGPFGKGPTYETREWQYRKHFDETMGDWFCFVAERPDGRLVGFAIGEPFESDEISGYAGRLNKIYVLRDYHRLGIGRRLVGHIVRRFLSQGIDSMLLFSDVKLPCCRFYEALGGQKLKQDRKCGNYGWKDLQTLASLCPAD
jgi:GNAT superfamily N-acetyltransferase